MVAREIFQQIYLALGERQNDEYKE
jgi:hypothetical protein